MKSIKFRKGKKRGVVWEFVEVIEEHPNNPKWKCSFCGKIYKGAATRVTGHFFGEKGSIAACRPTAEKKQDFTAALAKIKAKENTGEAESSSTPTPGTIEAALQVSSNLSTERAIANFFYENGIAFNVAESPSFKEMLRAVQGDKSCIIPPTRRQLATKLLDAEVQRIRDRLGVAFSTISRTGGTLSSDGWSSVSSQPLLNFMLTTPQGTAFVDSIDTSGPLVAH